MNVRIWRKVADMAMTGVGPKLLFEKSSQKRHLRSFTRILSSPGLINPVTAFAEIAASSNQELDVETYNAIQGLYAAGDVQCGGNEK